MYKHTCVEMYMYKHTYVDIYIYIYIYKQGASVEIQAPNTVGPNRPHRSFSLRLRSRKGNF